MIGGSGRLVSCDWGTSTLRLRWVDATTGAVLGEVSSPEGIRHAHREWQERGGDRAAVYLDILARRVAELAAGAGTPVGDAVVVSGMASSSLGLMELPYAGLPFPLDGARLPFRVLEHRLPRSGLPVVLLSGIRSATDVMRGEEVQLMGLRAETGGEPAVFVLPGTHSKHVDVQGGVVTGFRTYMTGEVFEAVATHTVLRASVRRAALTGESERAFREGVARAVSDPLLHALFRVRTHALFGEMGPEQNYWLLSGTLVGSELSALRDAPERRIYLCASGELRPLYAAALEVLGLEGRSRVLDEELMDRSAVLGQIAFVRHVLEPGGGGARPSDAASEKG